jgi:hypothetical protein
MAGPFRHCRTGNGSGVPPAARTSESAAPRNGHHATLPRCFVDRVTRSTGKDRDRANVQNKASDLWLCRAAYRNRTDDLRITRRIRVVHGCPGSHVCPARLASQSARVRDGPGSLLANPLARSIRAAAPTAAHPGRTAPGRPSGAARPALVRPTMPVMSGYCLQHAFQVCGPGSGVGQERPRPGVPCSQ